MSRAINFTVPLTFSVSCREDIENAVERLVALLNSLDGDPDLEPSLGAPEPLPNYGINIDQTLWCRGSTSDREHDFAEDGIADGDALHLLMQGLNRARG